MPLSRDPLGGGSNGDRSWSAESCSHGFREGKFTEPDLTSPEMMSKFEGRLRSMHVPGFLARRFAKDIPTLRRWHSSRSTA
jgi:Putative zinc ribbon domain